MFKLERLKFMTNEERYNMQNVGSNENLNIFQFYDVLFLTE